jgi:hypothetical protein
LSGLRAPVLLVATAVVAAVMGVFQRASGAEPTDALYVRLDYEVEGTAERCWDEREFRRAVAQSVGYDPIRSDAALSVEVHVDASAALVDGRVEWRNAEGASMGERRFRAKDGDCAALLTEMSFAVGLQIELLRPRQKSSGAASAAPLPSGSTPSASPSASPSSTSAPTSPKAKTPPSEQPPASKTPEDATADNDPTGSSSSASADDWRFWVGLGPSLAFGVAPSVTGHGRLFAGVRRGWLSLELGAEGTIEVTHRESDGSGFTQRLIGGSAMACGHVRLFVGCVVGKASQLRISGLDVDEPLSPTAPIVQAGIRLGAQWELSRVWFFTPHVDTLALLTPRAVELNEATVWDMPSFSVLAGIDVGGRFR